MRIVGYVLLAALGVLALLLLCAVVRTLCMKKKTSDYVPHPDPAREREYAEKLSRMVAYETVSHPDDPEPEKFRGFHALLAELYPTVHEKLEKARHQLYLSGDTCPCGEGRALLRHVGHGCG